jgi:hypothetical protein
MSVEFGILYKGKFIVIENRVLRRIFGTRREATGTEERGSKKIDRKLLNTCERSVLRLNNICFIWIIILELHEATFVYNFMEQNPP